MNFSSLRKNLDIWLAAIIWLTSLSLTLYAYAAISTIESPTPGRMNSVTMGKHSFRVLNAGKCAGWLSTNAVKETAYQVEAEGETRLKLLERDLLIHIKALLVFNPLRQLFNSKISLTAPDFEMNLSSEYINPLSVSLDLSQNGQSIYKKSLSIPGPVLISEDEAGNSFLFKYSYLNKLQNLPQLLQLSSSLRNGFDLSLQEVRDMHASCSESNEGAIDLSMLLNQIQQLAEKANALLDLHQ